MYQPWFSGFLSLALELGLISSSLVPSFSPTEQIALQQSRG